MPRGLHPPGRRSSRFSRTVARFRYPIGDDERHLGGGRRRRSSSGAALAPYQDARPERLRRPRTGGGRCRWSPRARRDHGDHQQQRPADSDQRGLPVRAAWTELLPCLRERIIQLQQPRGGQLCRSQSPPGSGRRLATSSQLRSSLTSCPGSTSWSLTISLRAPCAQSGSLQSWLSFTRPGCFCCM